MVSLTGHLLVVPHGTPAGGHSVEKYILLKMTKSLLNKKSDIAFVWRCPMMVSLTGHLLVVPHGTPAGSHSVD